ncbi:MAG: hypothetical protein H7256_12655 [Bdellovibrio sp.]|nr:hypothetical protein [Bdellovibrio sp.]
MMVLFSKYQLEKKNALNSKDVAAAFQSGALMKVIDDDQNWGVADLCPWPNLGDSSLEDEIALKGPLYQRTYELANEDLKARKNRRSLLADKFVENNWIITDFKNYSFETAISGTVKVKGSNEVDELHLFLEKLARYDVKIRLDFNSCLSSGEFNYFLNRLPDSVVEKIEYIEDPSLWSYANWKVWNQKVPLAIDFVSIDPFKFEDGWSVLIIKPTRQSTRNLMTKCHQLKKKFTLTSAMDHPVGVAHGLRFAQNHAENISGFLTLDLYQKNDFSRYFKIEQTKVGFSEFTLSDYGIGMTTTLNTLNWSQL